MKTYSLTVRDRAAAMSLGWNMIDLEAIKKRKAEAGKFFGSPDAILRLMEEDIPSLIAEVERQQGEIERLREALAVVASAKDNEITGYPYWIIVDPRQLMSPTVSTVAGMIKGLFFSRESADAYIASHRYKYSKKVGVFCCSGNESPEFRALYETARAALTPPEIKP